LFFLTCLWVFCAWAKPASAGESYDGCTGFVTAVPVTIQTPGTWCMKQNLASPSTSGAAISIYADNVTLDCNHFRLDGSAAGINTQAQGISTGGRNLIVRNCDVRGFYYGLWVGNQGGFDGYTGNHNIHDNLFSGNTYQGMRVTGKNSIIRHNRVLNTGGSPSSGAAIGISINGAIDVIDNTIAGVSAGGNSGADTGIFVEDIPGANIIGNRVRGVRGVPDTLNASGIFTRTSMVVRDNELIGDASAGVGDGIFCYSGQALVKKNVINGFPVGIGSVNCIDAGGNDFTR
jgi:hypothetical protein